MTAIYINANACTRLVYSEKGQAVLVGRTMDWTEDLNSHTYLRVYPRGIMRNGSAGINSLKWQAKYGSINAVSYDVENTDGMNEKGLAAHMLWLDAADYGKRDTRQPGLNVLLWAQYYLDNFATVTEAVAYTQTHPFQLVDTDHSHQFPSDMKKLTLHLALDDATGDSAILEYVAGQLHVYHGREYAVLTNDPAYDQQLNRLHDYEGLGGKTPLPGTIDASDRFVRAVYDLKYLPASHNLTAELASVFSVIDNVAEPYTIKNTLNSEPSPTVWRIVADLTHRQYYFGTSSRLNIIWANLKDFNLAAGAPIMELNVHTRQELTGNVRAKFQPMHVKAI